MKSRIIDNLDALVLPRNEIELLGRVVAVRRSDEIGFRTLMKIEELENKRRIARERLKQPVDFAEELRELAEVEDGDVESATKIANRIDQKIDGVVSSRESAMRLELDATVELLKIYLFSDVGARDKDGLSEELANNLGDISSLQFDGVVRNFTLLPPSDDEEETTEESSMPDVSQDSSDSMAEAQSTG